MLYLYTDIEKKKKRELDLKKKDSKKKRDLDKK